MSFNTNSCLLSIRRDHHVSISRSHSSLYNPDSDIDAINQQRAAARAVLRRSGSQGHLGFEELPHRPLFPSHENITNIQVKVNKYYMMYENDSVCVISYILDVQCLISEIFLFIAMYVYQGLVPLERSD
jgi:hypothetical protein